METPWKKEKRTKRILKNVVFVLSMAVFGGIIGFYSGYFIGNFTKHLKDEMSLPIFLVLMCLSMFVTFLLQIIIHETGHLVMGMLTGYEFLFYRAFNLLFIKEKGRINIRWHKNGETAGQCCLYPPKMRDPKKARYPFFLYHAGGVLFNLLFSGICIFILLYFRPNNIFVNLLLVPLAGWGILFFFQNSYPFSKRFTIDGSNIRRMMKSTAARFYFYRELRFVDYFSTGKHIKDLPVEELLPKPTDWYDDDFVLAMEYTTYGDYLSANGNYLEALKQYKMVIAYFLQVPEQIRNLLLIQYLFLLIVNDAPIEIVKDLYESDNIQSMKKKIRQISNVSVALYAYQILILKDEIEAEKTRKIHANFEGKTIYPFLYEMELRDMDYVVKRFREKKEE